MKQKALYYH